MKTFLAIFTCAENSENHHKWMKLSSEEQKERMKTGMTKLEKWMNTYKDQIIYDGGPLDENTKIVDNEGIHDRPSKVGAFFVVKAESHEEAAKIFVGHPHFSIFPGDGVEIIERAQRRTE